MGRDGAGIRICPSTCHPYLAGMGPLWESVDKRCGALHLCVSFGQCGEKGMGELFENMEKAVHRIKFIFLYNLWE